MILSQQQREELERRLRDYAAAFDTREQDWPQLAHLLRQASDTIHEMAYLAEYDRELAKSADETIDVATKRINALLQEIGALREGLREALPLLERRAKAEARLSRRMAGFPPQTRHQEAYARAAALHGGGS